MAAPLRPLRPYRSAWHFFGAELRYRRIEAGLSISGLAGKVFVSPTMLGKVEAADRFPSLDLTTGCDAVLDAGGALIRLHAFAAAERQHGKPSQTAAARLHPAQIEQLHRLLAAISSTTAVPAPAGTNLLDRIDDVLTAVDRFGPMWRSASRVRRMP
jgi:transcriptional regulator with XRE-family HTH domain